MLRLKSTTISVTMEEVKDYETRRRYRRYLRDDHRDMTWGETAQSATNMGRVCSTGSLRSQGAKSHATSPPIPSHREPLALSSPQSSAGTRGDADPSPRPADGADQLPGAAGDARGGLPHSIPSTPIPMRMLAPPRRPQTSSERLVSHQNLGGGFQQLASPASQAGLGLAEPRIDASVPTGPTDIETLDDGAESPAVPLLAVHMSDRFHLEEGGEVEGDGAADPRGSIQLREFTTPRHREVTRRAYREGGSSVQRTAEGTEHRIVVETMADADSPGSDSMRLQIYDDSRPASSQPQTPQNLPEFRHRSRLLGTYTAPVYGSNSGPSRLDGPSWRRRRQGRRTPSPGGLDTPGFQGLYGGLENADDLTLYEQAPRRPGQTGRGGPASESADDDEA